MATRYELYLTSDTGERLAALTVPTTLHWARRVNEVGAWSLTFAANAFDRNWYRPDRRVEFWREADGGPMQLVCVGLCRRLTRRTSGAMRAVEIGGPDALDLLRRRVVAASEASAEASKTGTADDLLKAYCREQLGADAAAARSWSAYLAIDADVSAAPAVDYDASYKRLLAVCQDVARASAELGTRLYFDVTGPTLRLRTYVGQRGTDRTATSGTGRPLIGEAYGNLADPVLEEDASDEVTAMYALGEGVETARDVQEVVDTVRAGASVFGRIEDTADGWTMENSDSLADYGRAALYERRPRVRFTGRLLDVPGCRMGIDWNYGDRVTAEYEGERYDCTISALSVTYAGGAETIEAVLEND